MTMALRSNISQWGHVTISGQSVTVQVQGPREEMVDLGVRIIIYVLVMTTALVLNCIVLWAYSCKMKKSICVFVVSLSLCDFINSLGFSTELVQILAELPEAEMELICLVHSYCTHVGTIVSASLVCCISLDRYLKVKHKRFGLSQKQCLWLVFGIVMTSLIMTLPYVIVYGSRMLQHGRKCWHLYFKKDFASNANSNAEPVNSSYSTLTERDRSFLLPFYGVLCAYLMLVLFSVTFLYIKLSSVLLGKSAFKDTKNSLNKVTSVVSFCTEDEIGESLGSVDMAEGGPEDTQATELLRGNEENGDSFRTRNLQITLLSTRQTYVTDEIASSQKSVRKFTEHVEFTSKPKDSKSKDLRRKSVTLSVGSLSRIRRYSRSIVMLVLSLFTFLFYFPNIVAHIVTVINVEFTQTHPVLFEVLLHSQVVCFLANPILYAFLNRGFKSELKSCCCCGSG